MYSGDMLVEIADVVYLDPLGRREKTSALLPIRLYHSRVLFYA